MRWLYVWLGIGQGSPAYSAKKRSIVTEFNVNSDARENVGLSVGKRRKTLAHWWANVPHK